VQFAATKFVSPLMTKGLGLRWCLAWAVDNRLSNIIIESNAEVVVKCLYGAHAITKIELVILDCLNFMTSLSSVVVVSILVCQKSVIVVVGWVASCMNSYRKDLLSIK
jgi:hypothetical protein